MKNNPLILLVLISLLFSCSKRPDDLNEVLPTGTELFTGSFMSNAHPTNGMITIVEDTSNTKHLVIQNFSTDNGPDLKVYLSTNTSTSDYISLGDLKANSGDFSYTIGNTINVTTYNHVLIWCEDFSVLFGHGVLN